ncbi:hypothetical protein NDU88_011514 [Pleurodeles waltl]|uniref:Uncharacterized protein n=1 Tax=Pleurodeles waltl TaxID=8319 RepID=A0AAV7Q1K4_PLEWA|nr:hypothetical protein NDU88_011514 [Pleurodeles waltl]
MRSVLPLGPQPLLQIAQPAHARLPLCRATPSRMCRWRCLSDPIGPPVIAEDVPWHSAAGECVLWAHSSGCLVTATSCGVSFPAPYASLLHGQSADV